MKIIIIGGGAAGFFSAINIAEKRPGVKVLIIEKSSKLLSKVLISGGGRCNVTNARSKPSELVHFYPRGNKKLHPVFKTFSTKAMVDWLFLHGVATKIEDDLRVFPVSDSSQTIFDCFVSQASQLGIEIHLREAFQSFESIGHQFEILTDKSTYIADKLIIASGSSPALWKVLEKKFDVNPPVPSLFTFNIKDPRIQNLQGLSFEQVNIKVAGTKLQENGALLITHWGLSGPAILKLSSWGALELNTLDYQFDILVNFLTVKPQTDIRKELNDYQLHHPKRNVHKYPLWGLPRRFWEKICDYCEVAPDKVFSQLSKKQINKLLEELTQGRYSVSGKSMFKDEFVTAGGIKLSEINLETFEAKKYPGLYFAGEVLDIDALTGGFNFQACWSAGWIISEQLSK